MNLDRLIHVCVAGMLASAGVSPLAAQSLADAAARAREQRQTHQDTPTFTDADLGASASSGNGEALALELTMPLIQQYSSVRTALLQTMVQSPSVAKQVLGAIGRAGLGGVAGLEQEYEDTPAAVDAIRAGRMTVHSYLVTEVAFMSAVGVLAGKLALPGSAPGMMGRNIEFPQRHQPEIAGLFQNAAMLQARAERQAALADSTPK